MEIKINVMFDVTPRLESLAQTALAALWAQRDSKGMELTGDGRKREETAPETVPGQDYAIIPPDAFGKVQIQAAPDPVQAEAPENPIEALNALPGTLRPMGEAPETNPEPAAPEPETAIPDDETMRTMMDMAISKVCGTNDWKESQDSRVIALRRSCTGCFREISRRLGAEKPTALQGEGRNRFLGELDNIYVDAGQCKAVWQAF